MDGLWVGKGKIVCSLVEARLQQALEIRYFERGEAPSGNFVGCEGYLMLNCVFEPDLGSRSTPPSYFVSGLLSYNGQQNIRVYGWYFPEWSRVCLKQGSAFKLEISRMFEINKMTLYLKPAKVEV